METTQAREIAGADSVYTSAMSKHLSAPRVIEPAEPASRLERLDWDFRGERTDDGPHGLHPYPAKFIPQIPRTLIDRLSAPGDVVADIFCGSGTTLVEALRAGRHAVGVDANPIACLISEAKTARLDPASILALAELAAAVDRLVPAAAAQDSALFRAEPFVSRGALPEDESLDFWFYPHVIQELAEIRDRSASLAPPASALARACLSAIIVGVSKQDSDTRYVRREKNIRPGDTLRRYASTLREATASAAAFTSEIDRSATCRVLCANTLERPDIGRIDLVVTSPPYPNAYSYHLYHRTRMAWLGMDSRRFKEQEIGSHRKYSSKGRNGATRETFRQELDVVFDYLSEHLRSSGFACFVVGDSKIRGELVRNDHLVVEAARGAGFELHAGIRRRLQTTKRAFNPKIGRIKEERILVLRRS